MSITQNSYIWVIACKYFPIEIVEKCEWRIQSGNLIGYYGDQKNKYTVCLKSCDSSAMK